MLEVVIATKSRPKIKEIKSILKGEKIKFLTFDDFENFPEIVEDGNSYKENAIKKAKAVAKATGKIALADDSGIEVEYLGGKPGIYSSRFVGENSTDEERNKEILNLLADVPESKRKARYVCVIAVSTPQGLVKTFEGVCRGRISKIPRGKYGFGYDPIFFVPSYKKNMAELPPSLKNKISHRARALNKARSYLRKLGEWKEKM